jgi:hypothetical protein
MSKYKVTFKGGLVVEWTFEHKPNRQEIKDTMINDILNMSVEELEEHIKISSVEEIID